MAQEMSERQRSNLRLPVRSPDPRLTVGSPDPDPRLPVSSQVQAPRGPVRPLSDGTSAAQLPVSRARGHSPALTALLFCVALVSASCDSLTGPGGIAYRTYAMGFTPFPYAMTPEAYVDTWTVIATDGDMAAMHFDGGVPWQEALDDGAYPTNFQDELDYSDGAVPAGHVRYVAVTPISNGRDGLALNRGEEPNEPLDAPWSGYTFSHEDVAEAYKNHCERMIEELSPDYFAYGIEVNMLEWLNQSEWDAFVELAEETYTHLKSLYPELPVFLTFQADAYHNFPLSQQAAIEDVLPYTDMIAVSGYPFTNPLLDPLGDPGAVRSDYFSALADLAPDLPFAVAETGWPAEPVGDPYWIDIPATEETQLEYVERMFEDADILDAHFVCWFFWRDYDDVWEEYFQYEPNAATLRTWRDTGLYAGDGTARQSLGLWLNVLQLTRVEP